MYNICYEDENPQTTHCFFQLVYYSFKKRLETLYFPLKQFICSK